MAISKKKQLEDLTSRILNLNPEIRIEKSEISTSGELISLSIPVPVERTCVCCGSNDCIIRGSGTYQSFQHFPVNNRRIYLRIFKRRLLCRSCGASFYETPDWCIPRLRMSKDLYFAIIRDLTEVVSFRMIMRKECISESTIRSVFDSIEILHPSRLPKTLCIDEFKADTGYWIKRSGKWAKDSYNVNVTDWKRRVVIDVLQQKNLTFLMKHFKRHYNKYERDNVRFFVCDMSGSFISFAKQCFPKACICIDNFHIVQRLDKVVDDVRRRMQHYYKDNGDTERYTLLKHISYALKTKSSNQLIKWGNLTEHKRQKLEDAFSVAPDLREAYEALQFFHDILDSVGFSVQQDSLTEWFEQYRNTDVPELKTAVTVLYSYRSFILNAWRYDRSNGPCEGLNNKIKDVKRTMFGAHSFENFRKRILLTCGGLTPDSDNLIMHI